MILEMVGVEELGGTDWPIVVDSMGNLVTLFGDVGTRSVCLSTWSPEVLYRGTVEWTWQTCMTCVAFDFALFYSARGSFALLEGSLPR